MGSAARIEVLKRTPEELDITNTLAYGGEWVIATTLGCTHKIATWQNLDVGLGASLTKYYLPSIFESAYGCDTVAGKIFLQFSGMKMWDLYFLLL